MKNALRLGLVRRFEPWDHYVQPLLERNCEVVLMKGSSIRHNPGAMWGLLALEHEGLVTITDSDRAGEVAHDIERTELVVQHGLGHWRVPCTWGDDEHDCTYYRTIMACLNVAVFPRIALSGVVTFVPWNDRRLNHWFALDIE